MTRLITTKTGFTGGELAPEIHGRTDLDVYAQGARSLRNVIVRPTGGVSRRPGFGHLAALPGPGRLIPVASRSGTAVVALCALSAHVFVAGVRAATLATPWSEERLRQITWTPFDDGVLITHPEHAPRHLRPLAGVWTLSDLAFDEQEGRRLQPHARFAETVTLAASGTSGSVTLTASDALFTPAHQGVRFRLHSGEVEVVNPQSPTTAQAIVRKALGTGTTTGAWTEAAFSPARGWPRSAALHQGRLVFGGSRDLPGRLWFSRTGRPLAFDTGSGLDDESIVFDLATARAQTVRHLFAGRSLMVFTAAGEWIVTGTPLTPSTVQVQQQTHAGSLAERSVPPIEVEGAVLFVGPQGTALREFLFVDTEQAYRATDLAVLSRHLFEGPLDQAFDSARRLLLIARDDGSLASVTLERTLGVAAWSLLNTEGSVRSVAVADGRVHVLVERDGRFGLEWLTDGLDLDAAVVVDSAVPAATFTGLDHLEGRDVAVLADGEPRAGIVAGGTLTLDRPASRVVAGLRFRHVVEPMPGVPDGGATALGRRFRVSRVTFQILDSRRLTVDVGGGPRVLALDDGAAGRTGEVGVNVLGWRSGSTAPPWRIEDDTALPFTLLSVTTYSKVNQ
ncbi:hypothetical protein [Marinivivus vitaminiproducens]|uniref:hypothetical protein n=1 Tax=Marinivivus vitaminiproducens TaxID=3035935 RepID=UPI0027A3D14D|nr:hypothetical protein P4R82_04890 [Geminicoccaceae bacterium SCSIO 64248]